MSSTFILPDILGHVHFFPFNLNIGVDISAIVWDWYGHVYMIHMQFYAYDHLACGEHTIKETTSLMGK